MRTSGTCVWLVASGLTVGMPAGWCAAQDTPPPPEVAQGGSDVTPDAQQPDAVNATDGPAEPAGPGEPREGDGFAERIEQAAQRATALELERELAALLGPDGLPVELGPGPVRDALKDVATRCDLLAHSSAEPLALEVLVASQARVYNALVQDASAHGEAIEVARGLSQLRDAAHRLSEIDTPRAAAAGAYWLMLADLIDANRTITDPTDRRVFVRELLSRYVEDFGDAEPADDAGDDATPDSGYLLDARVALARLLNEAGEQRAAYDTLGPLTEAGPDDPRYEQVQPVLAHHALIGSAVSLDLPTAAGPSWRSEDATGRPVLMHIFAQGVGGSDDSIAELRGAIARARLGGYSVVSLHVGELIPDRVLPPWPTVVVEPSRRGVLDALGVDAVPMYVWLDAEGRVASVGKTLDVIRRCPVPVEADEADGGAEVAEDAAPGPDAPPPSGP